MQWRDFNRITKSLFIAAKLDSQYLSPCGKFVVVCCSTASRKLLMFKCPSNAVRSAQEQRELKIGSWLKILRKHKSTTLQQTPFVGISSERSGNAFVDDITCLSGVLCTIYLGFQVEYSLPFGLQGNDQAISGAAQKWSTEHPKPSLYH